MPLMIGCRLSDAWGGLRRVYGVHGTIVLVLAQLGTNSNLSRIENPHAGIGMA